MEKTILVQGFGSNDAGYPVHAYGLNLGKKSIKWQCPFYRCWVSMLSRCHSESFKERRPTYAGCTVVPEWNSFSDFKSWMLSQPWQRNHLDKDILEPGNKVYSPAVCVFVSSALNNFILDGGNNRNGIPVGASWHSGAGKFMARCRNPFTGKVEYLGLFIEATCAHEAWRKRKHEHALRYADMQTDKRIADALRIRYAQQATQ